MVCQNTKRGRVLFGVTHKESEMGFECALAVVLPAASTNIEDYYPGASDDIFFDGREKVVVPSREWRVLRYIDFGRVRSLVKSTSSLYPSDRAEGDGIYRARVCTASFLLAKFWEIEDQARAGNMDFVVPFIADHLIMSRNLTDVDDFIFAHRFKDVFERLSSSDVVTGLWTFDSSLLRNFKIQESQVLAQGILWEYNNLLLSGDICRAVTAEVGGYGHGPCGLVWHSSYKVAKMLTELLSTTIEEGVELRKDTISCTLVSVWRDVLLALSRHGARVIFLSGRFHTETRRRMKTMEYFL